TVPDVGRSSPASSPRSVVFPLPDGPTIATNSFASTRRSTPSRTVTSRGPLRYRFVNPSATLTMRLLAIFAFALVFHACSADADAPRAGHSPPNGSAPAADTPATSAEAPVVLFLGNSLTAGYGLTAEEAYPALIQRKIDEAGYPFRVVNAGVSGETSAGGLRRIDWLLRQPVAILVLALGANDALRGHDLD